MLRTGGGGGGYSEFFTKKYIDSGYFFWIQNFEFQYFLGVFRKMNIFGL